MESGGFESSDVGQTLISALVSIVLLIGIAWNLPDSTIRGRLMPILEPVAQVLGLEQIWKMYAPDVIRQLEFTDVKVTMSDGSVRTWNVPGGDKVIGPFSWYHWQKLKENVFRDATMRADFAHWVVREITDPAESPARVQIIERLQDIPPPGQPSNGVMHKEVLYDEILVARP
jgi:hypothetical protein